MMNPPPAAPRIVLPAAEAPEVSLLIPTTNQAGALEICLTSLAAHLPPETACEIIVVLNAATEEVKSLARNCAGLRIAESEVNLGVAGGYNLARSLASGRFLVLLHDDIEIGPGWLEPLLAAAAAYPGAGAIGSRVLNPDGSPQRAGSLVWSNGLTSPMDAPEETTPYPVDYCGTCAMLVRASLWDAMGGLDEQLYPAYFVDTDLCMGLRKLGATVLCAPASQLRHRAGSSTTSHFRRFVGERNLAWFRNKWEDFLTGHEPWAPDDPAAPARAQVRTRQRAATLAAAWQPLPETPHLPSDPAASVLRHAAMEAALGKAWSRHLETELAAARADAALARQQTERKRQEIALKNQRIAALQDRCGALKTSLEKSRRPSPWKRFRHWLKSKLTPDRPSSRP